MLSKKKKVFLILQWRQVYQIQVYALSIDGGILGQSWRKWLERAKSKWDCEEHGNIRLLRFNCYISMQKFHSWHQFAGYKNKIK